MNRKPNKGAKRRTGIGARITAYSAAVLLLLTAAGCAYENISAEMSDTELPDISLYLSEAESLRSEENVTVTTVSEAPEEETTVSVLNSDSQTISGDRASSSEGTASEASQTTSHTTSQTTSVTTAMQTESETSAAQTSSTEFCTDCSVPKADTAQTEAVTAAKPAASQEYDASFFEDDLFIGDSISTGYSLYGFFSEKNVFAKVGLNPSTALTKTVSTCYGNIGVGGMVSYTTPKRAYIMLGSNGIQWLSIDNMIECTEKLVNIITDVSPDTEVVIISVPPVTPEYDSTVEDVVVIDKINRYNASLNKFCRDNDLLFCDAASVLKNESGYFDYAFAEADGMHFKPAAYRTLLSKLQSDVMDYESAAAEEAAETEAEETEETTAQTEETDVTSETEKETEETSATDKRNKNDK